MVVLLQIRHSKGWKDKGLRFILAGRQLYEDDTIEAAQAPVLHCMVLDGPTQGFYRSQHRPHANAEPVDWVSSICTSFGRAADIPTVAAPAAVSDNAGPSSRLQGKENHIASTEVPVSVLGGSACFAALWQKLRGALPLKQH